MEGHDISFLVGGEGHAGGVATDEGDVQEVEQAAVGRHPVEAEHVRHGDVGRHRRQAPHALRVAAPVAPGGRGRPGQLGVVHGGGEAPGGGGALGVQVEAVAARVQAREQELKAVWGVVQ